MTLRLASAIVLGVALLRLYLLGPFDATLDGEPLAGLRSGKSRALLAYLATEAGRPHQRDHLAALLWGERPDAAARLSLRVALSGLREALAAPSAVQALAHPLEITRQRVTFTSDPDLCWVDSREFEELIAACETHLHTDASTCRLCCDRLARAAELYRGDFLADLTRSASPTFQEWRPLCQEHFHHRFMAVLAELIRSESATGNPDAVERYARQQLAFEPWREEAHRALMRALALRGDRCGALAQFESCRQILAQELGTQPDPETIAMYKAIRAAVQPISHPTRPSPLAPLIGRKAELAHLERLLADDATRLICLVGPPGWGKTRLALEAAGRAECNFGGGVHLVTAAFECEPDALDRAVADVMHFDFTLPRESLREALIAFLAQSDLLLVLDDLPVTPAIATWIAAFLQRLPSCKALVTAHKPLHVRGEHVIRIEGLPFPAADDLEAAPSDNADRDHWDSVDLFAACAQRTVSDVTFDDSDWRAIARICYFLEGMPLGIELAAAWMPILSCKEIADDLETDPRSFATPLVDAPPHRRSLGAVAEHTWGLLSREEQEALERLAVFCDPFDRAAAEAVGQARLPVLASLVSKAVVRRVGCGRVRAHPWREEREAEPIRNSCFALPELVRRWLLGRLPARPDELEAARTRHAAYFVSFLARRRSALSGAGREEALQDIGDQIANIKAAWEHMLSTGAPNQLRDAAYALFHFYDARGWYADGEAAFGGLDRVLGHGDPALRALAQTCRAWFAFKSGRHPQSQALFEESTAELRSLRDWPTLAFARLLEAKTRKDH